MRFCSVCKRYIELPADRTAADAMFAACGHDSTPRSHLARDVGRTQRAPRTTKRRTKTKETL
jgi:hypothetical protein